MKKQLIMACMIAFCILSMSSTLAKSNNIGLLFDEEAAYEYIVSSSDINSSALPPNINFDLEIVEFLNYPSKK